jgi:hypothetical protein
MAKKNENRPAKTPTPKVGKREPKTTTEPAPSPTPRDCAEAPAQNPKAA